MIPIDINFVEINGVNLYFSLTPYLFALRIANGYDSIKNIAIFNNAVNNYIL